MTKIKRLPKPEPQLENKSLSKWGIQSYDYDNLYPQNVQRIVGASRTGSGCLERYKDFIEGDGVADQYLASLKVNKNGETLADIHSFVSDDYATFDGFTIHVNYTIEGLIADIHTIPFENVRLAEPDEDGVVQKVALHPDWTGQTKWNGKQIKVTRESIDFIDVFNPDPAVVKQQIESAGGIEFYKGQVLYVSAAGYLRYPLAYFDSVLTDMSTDEGISNLMLRNARNNFLTIGAFVHYKSQGKPDEADDEGVETEDYSDVLRHVQGDMNALAIIDVEVESKDEVPEFVPFTGKNIDKDFTSTDAAVKESIYAKFGQEAFLAVRLGKLGFSGTIMQEANDDYARRCAKKQRRITRAYVDILSHWYYQLGVEPNTETLAVTPLTYAVSTIESINE